MQPTLINGFYMATNNTIGPWSGSLSSMQETNANIIRSFFIDKGWTIEAICGMLGNMQGESTVNPAYIQATNRYRLPNSAAALSDVPNSTMINFYMEYYGDTRKAYAIGLVQWDGYSTRNGVQGQKLVNYATDNNIAWFDGWTQLYRIKGEEDYDNTQGRHAFFNPVTFGGITYSFLNYSSSTASPETLAAAWSAGYERNTGGIGYRGENARRFYDWFTGPDAPDIIPPEDFLQPLPYDPDLPPFDPDDPVAPDVPGQDYLPAWLFCIMQNKRKELKQSCRIL